MFNDNLQTRGYVLALLSVFTAANTYFSSKYILGFVSVFQFGILWYGFGLIYNSSSIIFSGKFRTLFILPKKTYFVLSVFGLIEVIATTLFFKAIKLIENPAIVSFLGNISPALVVVLGTLLLKEKFNNKEKTGIIIALIGAFLVSFKWTLNIDKLFVAGSEYVLISAILVSINVIIAKKYIEQIKPELLSLTRVFALFMFSVIAILSLNQNFSFSKETVFVAMYGAFVGPFLGAYAQYSALKYIAASKVMIIQALKSFVILIFAFILLGLWPILIQVIGGMLTVSGIILVTLHKESSNNLKKNKNKACPALQREHR